MSLKARILLVNNIKLSINASVSEAFSIAKKKISKLGISLHDADFSVYKKSVDARNNKDILFVYSVCAKVYVKDGIEIKNSDITLLCGEDMPEIKMGDEKLYLSPMVVGTGPCGLFCALLLAEYGFKPIVLERGDCVENRKKAVEKFIENQILDVNTNIQFGAGGAGTFSDGKLITRINDPLTNYVLRRLCEFGAPDEIRYLSKPHVGTDILSVVVDNILKRIVELGGQILYNTIYITSKTQNGIKYAVTSKGDIPYGALVLAVGHSARDTHNTLISEGYDVVAKSFSVGMRIEHLREDIDKALYGDFYGHPALGHGEYNLSFNTKVRGVYTFCMCPGGEVVAAASEDGGVVVNGMSYHSRDGRNSNSAVACTVFKEDYGLTPVKAIEFQRNIEKLAYKAGGGNYSAHIITVGDFMSDRLSTLPSKILPTYMRGKNINLASPCTYLPEFVCKNIKDGIRAFDRKIKGFASPYAVLTGAETRTSSPVRIMRDNSTRLAIGKDYIYPCGEGAGYAGGITSAAIDGLKTAIALISRFKI